MEFISVMHLSTGFTKDSKSDISFVPNGTQICNSGVSLIQIQKHIT